MNAPPPEPTKAQRAENDDALGRYNTIARRVRRPREPCAWLHLAVTWGQPWGRKATTPKERIYR